MGNDIDKIKKATKFAFARPKVGKRTIIENGTFANGFIGRLAGVNVTYSGCTFFATEAEALEDAKAFQRACIDYLRDQRVLHTINRPGRKPVTVL